MLYDGAPMPAARSGDPLGRMAGEERVTVFGTSAKYPRDARRRPALAPARSARPGGAARDPLHRAVRSPSTSYDYVYRDVRAGRAAREHLRRHRHHLLLRARRPDAAGATAASCRCAGSAWPWTCGTTTGGRVRGEAGELVCTRPFPIDAGGVLERSRRRALPRRLLRALPGRLAPRRLGRDHAPRRAGDPRPERRDAQSGRRAHRHGGDLPAGGARCRRSSRAWSSSTPATGGPARMRGSCSSCGWRDGRGARRRARAQRIRRRSGQGTSPHHVPRVIDAVADIPRTHQRQDQRAGGARGAARPPGAQRRGAREPGGARDVFASPSAVYDALNGPSSMRDGATIGRRMAARARSAMRADPTSSPDGERTMATDIRARSRDRHARHLPDQRHRLHRVLGRQREAVRRSSTAPRSASALIGYRGPETGRARPGELPARAGEDPPRAHLAARARGRDRRARARSTATACATWRSGWTTRATRSKKAVERGATSVQEPTVHAATTHGEVIDRRRSAPTATRSTRIVERRNYKGLFLPGFVPAELALRAGAAWASSTSTTASATSSSAR